MAKNMTTWADLDKGAKRALLEGKPDYKKIAAERQTTIAVLQQQKEWYDTQPVYSGKGTVVGKDLGGTDPALFTMESEQLTYIDAITEIIDGIIENHKNQNDKKKVTNVKFHLFDDGKNRRLLVEENSGGIKQKKLDSVVTLGSSGWGGLYGVGVFGIGLKKGLRKIARMHHLFTWHESDPEPCEMEFSSEFWDNAGEMKINSTICQSPIMKNKKGWTIIHFNNLMEYDGQKLEFNDAFVKEIAMYYHQWIASVPGTLNIFFKQGDFPSIPLPTVDLFSEPKIKAEFTYHPGYEPRKFSLEMEGTPRKINGKKIPSKIKVIMTFGLTKVVPDTDLAGVYVYGNDRFFHGPDKTGKWGFGLKTDWGKYPIPNYHATTNRFRVKFDVEAENAIDIPWNVGAKNGYNTSKPVHKKMSEMVCCAAQWYMPMARDTDNSQTEFFDINGINTSDPNGGWTDAFFPVEKSSKSGEWAKHVTMVDTWVSRKDTLSEVIPFSKIQIQGEDHGAWVNEDLKDILKICKLKKESAQSGDYSDYAFVDALFSLYQPTKATTKKIKSKVTKKTTSKKKVNSKSKAKIATKSKAKLKKHAKIKIDKKKINFQANLKPETLKELFVESNLPKDDMPTAMKHLWSHFMLTKELYDDTVMSKTKGISAIEANKKFDAWVKGKKWEKKKGKYIQKPKKK